LNDDGIMKGHRQFDESRRERGVALLIAIFSLMLISVVAIALIVSSGTDSALASKSSTITPLSAPASAVWSKERAATEVLEAASGEEALDAVAREQLDLVILDLNLPSLGGLELLRRVAATRPALPILVFSQHSEAIYAAKAMEAGARGFLSKNAAPEELLEAMESVLAGGTAIERESSAK